MKVIELSGVSKRYRRTTTGGPRTLRDLGLRHRVEHWALQDVSFDVNGGESVGLIGLNGSGKSTLLRVIAGTTAPTRGTVRTNGVLGGLLALGSGLDPSLSAEENAFTGAVLAGVPRNRIAQLLPRIAAFAELEGVFHEPMRTFSDGMKVRLAFSTSIHVSPQILLIDEVLAVGDARFREKCIDRLRIMREEGMTFVIVSHTLSQIESLCDRVIWVERGRVRYAGPTSDVLERYEESNQPEAVEREGLSGERRFGTGSDIRMDGLELIRSSSAPTPIRTSRSGQPVSVLVHLRNTSVRPRDVRISVSIHRSTDFSRPLDVSSVVSVPPGPIVVRVDIDRLDLANGDYWLNGGAFTPDYSECFDYAWQSVPFAIDGPTEAGPLAPPMRWSVQPRDSREPGEGSTTERSNVECSVPSSERPIVEGTS